MNAAAEQGLAVPLALKKIGGICCSWETFHKTVHMQQNASNKTKQEWI